MFQSWNLIPFQWSKQRARLLDADQFTLSQLRLLNESSKDHIWILCANKTSQTNKAKLSEDLERIRTSECDPAIFPNATFVQSIRTTRKLFISSALSGSSDPTLQTFNLYKDYKLHSWWCWCCIFAANVVLVVFCFSLIISYLCISFWIHEYSGWIRSSRIGNYIVIVVAGLGLKKVAQQ